MGLIWLLKDVRTTLVVTRRTWRQVRRMRRAGAGLRRNADIVERILERRQ